MVFSSYMVFGQNKLIYSYSWFDLGIPSLALRPIDPLFAETMNIVHGNKKSPVNIRIDLENVTIVGYSDMKITRVQ